MTLTGNLTSNSPIITMTRGDNFLRKIFINKGCKLRPSLYELQDNDYIYIAIMEPGKQFETAIVKKVLSKRTGCLDEHGLVKWELTPEDTEFLHTGTYYYTVKLRQIEGNKNYITTLIPNTLFYIT